MLSEEGATEVWLSLLLTSLSLPLAIKNLKRGKTSSYERHPQYLRMVGFQEKNLFKLSLFLEFFSKRRKCLPEVEFFPWVFGLSFVLEFQFFRRPVWKKKSLWYNKVLRLHLFVAQEKPIPRFHYRTGTSDTARLTWGCRASGVDPLRNLRPRGGVEQLPSHLPRCLARDLDTWPRSAHHGKVSSFIYYETFR